MDNNQWVGETKASVKRLETACGDGSNDDLLHILGFQAIAYVTKAEAMGIIDVGTSEGTIYKLVLAVDNANGNEECREILNVMDNWA